MCDKAVLENGGALNSVPNCYKNQEMCNKAVDNYRHALEFVPSVASLKMVDLCMSEDEKKDIFEYLVILTHTKIMHKNLIYFKKKNFFLIFEIFCPKIYIKKFLKQFSTEYYT